jgi:hypothetical protein
VFDIPLGIGYEIVDKLRDGRRILCEYCGEIPGEHSRIGVPQGGEEIEIEAFLGERELGSSYYRGDVFVTGRSQFFHGAEVMNDESWRHVGDRRDLADGGAGCPVSCDTADGGVADACLRRPVIARS